jgi:L-aspartate N-monooxygenase (nitrosuccinate-forming)
VTRSPYHLINHQGESHQGRFAFGVPTEGVHWVTAAGARPGIGSVMLSDADAVARAALRTVPGPAENATAVVARPLGRPAGLRDRDLSRPSTTATA